jgi:hypothetical protein
VRRASRYPQVGWSVARVLLLPAARRLQSQLSDSLVSGCSHRCVAVDTDHIEVEYADAFELLEHLQVCVARVLRSVSVHGAID